MANITITVTDGEKAFIEKVGNDTAKQVVQKVVDDWLNNQVELKYKPSKTRDQKIDELANL